jgi:anti-sigma B factor antagonist
VCPRIAGLLDLTLADEPVEEGTHLLAPSGEVDVVTAPKLGRRLLALLEEGKRRLVVDLSDITFIDSAGIGVLLNARRQICHRHGELVVVCPNERVRRSFQIMGLTEHLRIYRSRREALAGLGGLSPA